jgi:hypothetical protein
MCDEQLKRREPARPYLAPDDVILQNKREMKTQTKPQTSRNRIVEVILAIFIVVFVVRAVPNLVPFPQVNFESEARWGEIARAQLVVPHRTATKVRTSKIAAERETLRTFLVQPKKFWRWYPIGVRV